MSGYISAFQPVTYTLDNGIYSTILASGAVAPTTSKTKNEIIDSSIAPPSKKKKKFVDPFDPEATVPLPFQLDDQFGPYSSSVWKRNERERSRVRCVNEGYDNLRIHLPLHDGEKRISKVDTLRLAIRYITHLEQLLKNSLHQYNCTCFAGFQEESEGNIQLNFQTIFNRQ
ncbi:unnamed protein product [Caenorhabditis angaria]|uniref:BHLH domain-containing protein n=1 Tax=Caenorhabditis angaria TaxID=860376 RepID=A0A9P1MVH5_9PELO|nr:unnamed protein product [Caenorhabditis angaria]